MWINSGAWSGRLVLLAWLAAGPILAQEGQYRSKILLDPGGLLEEGAAQSIEELEQQMGNLSDPYAIAISGRQLARQYVQRKEYEKAVQWYQAALQADGLSPLADRELQRELAQVYLLQENFDAAAQAMDRVMAFELEPEPGDFLLLADLRYRLGDYVGVVGALDTLRGMDTKLAEEDLQRILALYYRAGAYPQSTEVLQALLVMRPEHAQYWHQLAAVYLVQNQRREALDQLLLAREKGVAFDAEDIRLMADLLATEGNPYGAAEVWQSALSSGTVEASGEHYRRLFEFWLQAREQDRARQALEQAALLTGDTELNLYLAQLHYEAEDWAAMQATVLDACQRQLEDRYVSRANFLLGLSQLKLGDEEQARRSFINATLIGGAGPEAAQWLRYMEAEPASAAEAKRIVSPCHGSEDKRARLANEHGATTPPNPAIEESASLSSGTDATVEVKTVSARKLFGVAYTLSATDAAGQTLDLATQLLVALVRAGGDADGPMELFFDWPPAEQKQQVTLALPVRGNPHSRGRYRLFDQGSFSCATMDFEGTWDEMVEAWGLLARMSEEAGHTPSGKARIVYKTDATEPPAFAAQLQLGIE